MIPQYVDQLILVHFGSAFDPDLFGLVAQVRSGPVFVFGGLPAYFACLFPVAVGDAGRFFFAHALVPKGFILFFVFDAWIFYFSAETIPAGFCIR
jgi:hypothetical protein